MSCQRRSVTQGGFPCNHWQPGGLPFRTGRKKRVSQHGYLSIMTSVDLMMTVTASPAFRPSCLAEVRLMRYRTSMLSTASMTSFIHVAVLHGLDRALDPVPGTEHCLPRSCWDLSPWMLLVADDRDQGAGVRSRMGRSSDSRMASTSTVMSTS